MALAPAGKIEHISNPILTAIISKYTYYGLDFFNKLPFVHWYRLFDFKWQKYQHEIIAISPYLSLAWDRVMYNSNIKVDEPSKVQDLVGHIPGGVSLKNLFHYV